MDRKVRTRAHEILQETVFASEVRMEIFNVLRDKQQATRAEICDEVDCVKGAVIDAVDSFERYGLAERVEDTGEHGGVGGVGDGQVIAFRPSGDVVADGLTKLLACATVADELQPFFAEVDQVGDTRFTEIAPRLHDADVVVPPEDHPVEPQHDYRAYIDAIERRDDDLRELVHRRTPSGEYIAQKVAKGALQAEFVIPSHVMDVMNDERVLQPLVEKEAAFRFDGPAESLPDFTLSFAGEGEDVVLLAYDDAFVYLRTVDSEVRDWAEEVYNRFKSRSELEGV